MIDKLFIEGVNYYQFAAVVEDEILAQTFPASDGQPITLSSRRTFTPSETANRLEIGVGGDFFHPITLDCRPLSNDRLLVTPACNHDSYQPILEKLLHDIRLFWGIPQPAPASVQPAPPAPPLVTPSPVSQPACIEDQHSSPQPARRVARSMNIGTAQAVAEAKYLMTARGITKTAACDCVGIDRRTYNRWCDHEAVANLVETMRDHPPG
jgi:hypothetical protein